MEGFSKDCQGFLHLFNVICVRIQASISVDLGIDLHEFRIGIRRFGKKFCKNSDTDVLTILASIHTMWPGGVRASRLNPPPPALGREQCVLNAGTAYYAKPSQIAQI